MNDLIKELRDMVGELSSQLEYHDPNSPLIDKADKILSSHEAEQGEGMKPCKIYRDRYSPPKPTEPLALAELADRKGAGYMTIFYPWSHNQAGWCIRFSKTVLMFEAPTYDAAEQAARAYLEGLADREGVK